MEDHQIHFTTFPYRDPYRVHGIVPCLNVYLFEQEFEWWDPTYLYFVV